MKLLLISPTDVYATLRLKQEADSQGVETTVMTVRQLQQRGFNIAIEKFDALFVRQGYADVVDQATASYLAKLTAFVKQFEQSGKVVVDQSIAEGTLGLGKYHALQVLRKEGIKIPHTEMLVEATSISYPVIVKWIYGFGAKHTYLVKDDTSLAKIKNKYEAKELMVQKFVEAQFEYKVITVGYKTLPVVLKLPTNHNKFLPDLAKPEVLQATDVPQVVELAENSARILRRELAKTDILESGGQKYVLEVNRWPGFQYFEKSTKFNVAKAFLDYISSRL